MSFTPQYSGRELSWLQFNKRVLEEAIDSKNPLLEQLRFLAIFASNLDEYFMIRISGMKSQVDIGLSTPDKKTGYMASEYLNKMLKKSKQLISMQYEIYQQRLEELNTYIKFVPFDELSKKKQDKMNRYFKNIIYPILTPIRFSSYMPFPLLPNLSVYLISKLQDAKGDIHYSVVTVPKNVERVVHVKKDHFILLEDLIVNNISYLYPGLDVLEVYPFRITRDFDIEFDDQSDDFAKSVMSELKNRKRGDAVRLEISNQASPEVLSFLKENLDIHKKFIIPIDGPIDLTFLHELHDKIQTRVGGLSFVPIPPINPRAFSTDESMFDTLRKKDVLLFHPHHSYEPIIRLIKEACEDPLVVAIKQTIYRTNKDSRIMEYLVKAAESGKQVTVLFELRARFDEENNLYWGTVLERAGAHVIYGVPNLKTHSKVLLIVRKDKNTLERFVHFGTGNYNEDNAKIYTDASYFSSKKLIGSDATHFFNYISSYSQKPRYKRLVASPNSIRDMIFDRIDQEIANQETNQNGRIIFKVNSITDVKMINKLYEASQKGVQIDLIARGICCLVPQVEGLSENIHVRSIVGRYLEHMRIYYFHNNDKPQVYLASADLMTRNMETRIELALPIYDPVSKKKIIQLLHLQLEDNVKARENIEGHYDYVKQKTPVVDSQLELYHILK
ncbi:polyphosphate kinase 1 [Candidatus Xianfuyuplasma coldseepsis]|uniref:Polyphosphate kinase n=1 Tax=Candidatus Xianfuyuplasma coldseepsis TaxID=2782163 RepID=A0A7L7KQ91_9MOLU|nr:polyphosphate kinase 1 [Xianfuyuplasma coldseepsis]QMS84599.1 polyphosphate kinase 1 [Xianfuyuplasma coldseepsis]